MPQFCLHPTPASGSQPGPPAHLHLDLSLPEVPSVPSSQKWHSKSLTTGPCGPISDSSPGAGSPRSPGSQDINSSVAWGWNDPAVWGRARMAWCQGWVAWYQVAAVAVQDWGFGPATVYQPRRSVTVSEEFGSRTNGINAARPFTLRLHQP